MEREGQRWSLVVYLRDCPCCLFMLVVMRKGGHLVWRQVRLLRIFIILFIL